MKKIFMVDKGTERRNGAGLVLRRWMRTLTLDRPITNEIVQKRSRTKGERGRTGDLIDCSGGR